MTVRDFDKLPICKFDDAITLHLHDYFLTPELESQKSEKKKGDTVAMYMVTEIKPNGNILYQPVYDILVE